MKVVLFRYLVYMTLYVLVYILDKCLHGSKNPHFKEAISRLAGADPRGMNLVASHPF